MLQYGGSVDIAVLMAQAGFLDKTRPCYIKLRVLGMDLMAIAPRRGAVLATFRRGWFLLFHVTK